ncbi:hypothetical protein HELRODRAFT_183225 [Helobdella robusta]|uniref:Uncharacterized protein n=1 Tax=Helobdella robusta TaxID=6412 RepID=T1FJC3_HELRO|nr:hypothetical protein HELRODRAFT_183225 [Helobdella robusta]ESO11438.1 hypothetical protein HELRODRAFT_183225 [Helobdella robusta]
MAILSAVSDTDEVWVGTSFEITSCNEYAIQYEHNLFKYILNDTIKFCTNKTERGSVICLTSGAKIEYKPETGNVDQENALKNKSFSICIKDLDSKTESELCLTANDYSNDNSIKYLPTWYGSFQQQWFVNEYGFLESRHMNNFGIDVGNDFKCSFVSLYNRSSCRGIVNKELKLSVNYALVKKCQPSDEDVATYETVATYDVGLSSYKTFENFEQCFSDFMGFGLFCVEKLPYANKIYLIYSNKNSQRPALWYKNPNGYILLENENFAIDIAEPVDVFFKYDVLLNRVNYSDPIKANLLKVVPYDPSKASMKWKLDSSGEFLCNDELNLVTGVASDIYPNRDYALLVAFSRNRIPNTYKQFYTFRNVTDDVWSFLESLTKI